MPKLPFMHQKRHEIEEQELQGFKYFKIISGLLEKLHEVGCARDRAGNRLLHMDQYVARLPGYAPDLNPVEDLWGNLKGNELANQSADNLGRVGRAVETGMERVKQNGPLLFGFLKHTGLSL